MVTLVLENEPAFNVFFRLDDPRQLLHCASVSTEWRQWADDERLWRRMCRTAFQLATRRANDGQVCTWKRACQSWCQLSGFSAARRCASLRLRAIDMWSGLGVWTGNKAPEIWATVNAGASSDSWTDVCSLLSIHPEATALEAVRCVYEIHDGQTAPASGTENAYSQMRVCGGLLGGYSAYDSLVCSWLLPLAAVHKLNGFLIEWVRQGSILFEHKLCIATSPCCEFDQEEELRNVNKFIAIDTRDGMLSSLAVNELSTGWVPCTPVEVADCGGMHFPRRPDQLLVWLEEYQRRLHCGVYSVNRLLPQVERSNGINLFAAAGPEVATNTERGIAVHGRSLFHAYDGTWFYSITVRLLPPGQAGHMSAAQRGFETCQLVRRHWEIVKGGQQEHVRGMGVIGKYPLLTESGWRDDEQSDEIGAQEGDLDEGAHCEGTFVYQSCTDEQCLFGGELLFVPGSIEEPTGKEFAVRVAQFKCNIPQFLF